MKTIFEVDKKNKRFAYYDGYKFDRYIFRSVILFLVIMGGLGVWLNGGINPVLYSECPITSYSYCKNPFYMGGLEKPTFSDVFGEKDIFRDDCRLYKCNQEFLLAGESAGVKPNFIIKWSGLLSVCLIIFGFLYNHRKYNKGFVKGRIDWKDFDFGGKK